MVVGGGGGVKSFSCQAQLLCWVEVELGLGQKRAESSEYPKFWVKTTIKNVENDIVTIENLEILCECRIKDTQAAFTKVREFFKSRQLEDSFILTCLVS